MKLGFRNLSNYKYNCYNKNNNNFYSNSSNNKFNINKINNNNKIFVK